MQIGKWSAQQSIRESELARKTNFRALFKELDAATLITAEELAELLCVSLKAIYCRLKAGKIPRPVIHENRCIRWRVSDIRAFLESMHQVPGESARVLRKRPQLEQAELKSRDSQEW